MFVFNKEDMVRFNTDTQKLEPIPQTTQERFHSRIKIFREKNLPVWKHHFWWFMHNAVAHPLIGICPNALTFLFHDFTSKKIMGE